MQSTKKLIIGIIGDGQLALMLAESLMRKNLHFLCLLQSEHSPMERLFPDYVTRDQKKFVTDCDVFTLENEFLKSSELATLLGDKKDSLFPELQSYRHFADKISQRTLFKELNLPSPHFQVLHSLTDKLTLAFPLIAKAATGGYDGKGVRVVSSPEMLQKTAQDFGLPLLLEEKVKLKTEIAQGFVKTHDGKLVLLPLVETLQQDGICHLVQYPAKVSDQVRLSVETAIARLYGCLTGIFNFEFFVDENDQVTINEGAPRPHNSQHLTIDASSASQFDLLAEALSNRPFSKMVTSPSIMVNILGQSHGNDVPLSLPDLPDRVKVTPKLYGKEKCAPGRKMGHVNIVDESGTYDLKSLGEKILREYRL